MNATVVCRDVRPATESDKACVVVASRENVRHGTSEIDLTDPSILSEVRNRLHAAGIALGKPTQSTRNCSTQSGPRSPVQIIAHDENGKQHRLVADSVEEYSLSSGSILYFLYLSEVPADCQWLIGRTLELSAPAFSEQTQASLTGHGPENQSVNAGGPLAPGKS